MPELPEVETTIKGLKPLISSSILSIKINTPKLRFFIPKNISLIKIGTKITDIKRRGKFIIIELSNNNIIVIHLGMSGRLRLYNTARFQHQKHDHFILRTKRDQYLIFNDARRFGFIDYFKAKDINERKYFLKLGIDALDKSLNGQFLLKKIRKSIVPIKQLLLDQRIIAGIGNIYASEILFNAKISPLNKGKTLVLKDCNQIINSTKLILKKAINAGGSTLRDYVSTDGTLGNFQNNFKVYSREGEKILGKSIFKIIQYGRSTYYCPDIQKK